MEPSNKVDDGQVVSMAYTLHVDGKLVDASDPGTPLQFIQGMGQILPALEQQLYDMQIGGTKSITLSAKDGYGEENPEAFMEIPRESFPTSVPLEIGTHIELKDHSGHPAIGSIEAVTKQAVRLNMNHPLAGKQLQFDVTISGLRPASDEEVSHGHVHAEGGIDS
jgi:FKBP-type peptidyl-prolyl cis-trans isomerase SlyD